MAFFESILGSLTAAAIAKITKEVSKRLADLKRSAQEIKDDELRQKLEKEIERMEKELKSVKEKVAKQITEALTKPIEKIFDLNRINPAFEKAHAKCKPNMSTQDSQKISVELGRTYIREAIDRLREPLRGGEDSEEAAIIKDANRLMSELTDIYKMYQNRWDFGAVSSFSMKSDELVVALDKVIKRRVELA